MSLPKKPWYLYLSIGLLFLIIQMSVYLVVDRVNSSNSRSKIYTYNDRLSVKTKNKTYNLDVEIADSINEREKGLMFVKNLEDNRGMLFVFSEESLPSFYMKNTLIPLDIIFIDKDRKVLSIVHEAQPCKSEPCPTFSPESPVMSVLEVNAGWAKEHKVGIGDLVTFDSK